MDKLYDFFIAGVIQGSVKDKTVHAQNYRDAVKDLLAERAPGRKVFCPVDEHCNSVEYSDDKARVTFFGHLEVLRQCRVMIAYLPVASMGTAIEMDVARHNDIPIIAVTPMAHNWVVRLYSRAVLPDLAALAEYLTPERLADLGV